MKKKLIMIGIISLSTISLLLVFFYVKTKDIKYVSDITELNQYSNITMTLKNKAGTTSNITQTPENGYYKLISDCVGGTVTWNNETKKIKVKVTNIPLKCTLAFIEVTEDINIIAFTLNNTPIENFSALSTTVAYGIDYQCKDESNTVLTGARKPIITWSNATRKLNTSNIGEKIYCTVNFHNEDFTSTPWRSWAQIAGVNTTGYATFADLMADAEKSKAILTNSQAIANLIVNFSSLIADMKTFDNYYTDIVPLLLDANIAYNNRVALKLPYYLYKDGVDVAFVNLNPYAAPAATTGIVLSNHFHSTLGSYLVYRTDSTTNAVNWVFFYSNATIDITGYKGFGYDIAHRVDNAALSCAVRLGFHEVINQGAGSTVYQSIVLSTPTSPAANVDYPNIGYMDFNASTTGQRYLKFSLYYATHVSNASCYFGFKKIYLY